MTGHTVRILGTHGVPGAYGGFETAAENIALYLADRGWRVIVYCQLEGTGQVTYDTWRGIERVNIPVDLPGWKGTSLFDWKSIRHAAKHRDLCLTFGYNTAVFDTLLRIKGIPNIINMDGIEWSRARWGKAKQTLLWSNERAAFHVGDHLIADHPELVPYLAGKSDPRKISMITYGADATVAADPAIPRRLGLSPGEYLTLICRPIPENSILELVRGFARSRRGQQLAILGDYQPDADPYHRAVMNAANDDVVFLGAIYDQDVVRALRFHSTLYLHGHTVGGTNPSLVEAMAAGNPVLAHDNAYNRWVAGEAARYFASATDVADRLDTLLAEPGVLAGMSVAARSRHSAEFTWEKVAGEYEQLLLRFVHP